MKKIILLLGLLGFGVVNTQLVYSADGSSSNNNPTLWQDVSFAEDTHQIQRKVSLRRLNSFRQLSLNEALFQGQQEKISISDNTLSRSGNSLDSQNIISIPLPGGKSVQVVLEETQVLSPDLSEKYPLIKTWKATGVDNKAITGRIDFTHYGFHAMLTMQDGDTVFVERHDPKSPGLYKSFSKKENAESFNQEFQCGLHDHHDSTSTELQTKNQVVEGRVAARAASDLLTYRLAIAATGEYTQYHGSTGNAVSAITTTINRINQINERDLAVTFQIVNTLVYPNPATDPYSSDDAAANLEENALNLTSRLGSSTFDIGHLFTQGAAAGLALLGSACDDTTFTGAKAGGMTGAPDPLGDAFDVDFVAHELGHQLGATHTFNSETLSCAGGNRTASSAVEPGSGSTIMGYAGICGSNDLQNNSDAAYHVASLSQIFSFTRSGGGKECGSLSAVSNNEPEPNAGVDTVIPANTPFVLIGSAVDADASDLLGYSWEQSDVGTASNVDIDTGDNAIIRSWFPSASAKRYIPRLQDLFDGTRVRGEKLPITDRELTFNLTVRDGKGGFDWDEMKVKVSGGRSFQVTSHSSDQILEIDEVTTVLWDVAGTNLSPVSCNSVDISLLQADGKVQNIKLQTANDGVETVVVPDSALGTNSARFMVKCSGDISTFFNISSGDLRIVSSTQGDVIQPVITLVGSSSLSIRQGEAYIEQGATATDNLDGNITSNIVINGGNINTNAGVGTTYVIRYNVSDAAGNSASEVIRTVRIIAANDDNSNGDSSGGGVFDSMFLFMVLLALVLLGQRRKLQQILTGVITIKGAK